MSRRRVNDRRALLRAALVELGVQSRTEEGGAWSLVAVDDGREFGASLVVVGESRTVTLLQIGEDDLDEADDETPLQEAVRDRCRVVVLDTRQEIEAALKALLRAYRGSGGTT